MPESTEFEAVIVDAEIDILDYDKRSGKYRFKLVGDDIKTKREALRFLLSQAYELYK